MKKGDVYDQISLEKRLMNDEDAVSSLYLDSGYLWFQLVPVEANIENNKQKVEEVLKILKDLRDAWHIVNQQNRKSLLQYSQGGLSIQTWNNAIGKGFH